MKKLHMGETALGDQKSNSLLNDLSKMFFRDGFFPPTWCSFPACKLLKMYPLKYMGIFHFHVFQWVIIKRISASHLKLFEMHVGTILTKDQKNEVFNNKNE